jgi:hypothetical protein
VLRQAHPPFVGPTFKKKAFGFAGTGLFLNSASTDSRGAIVSTTEGMLARIVARILDLLTGKRLLGTQSLFFSVRRVLFAVGTEIDIGDAMAEQTRSTYLSTRPDLRVELLPNLSVRDPFMVASSHWTGTENALRQLVPFRPAAVTIKTTSEKSGGNGYGRRYQPRYAEIVQFRWECLRVLHRRA